MKTKSFFTTIIVTLLLTIGFYNCGGSGSNNNNNNDNKPDKQQVGMLPQDVDTTKGTVDAKTFASWFKDGKVTENGFVNPANSVTFPSNDNHDFYLWSEQMFLWLTSQDAKYGTKGSVLESPVFYTVSPPINGVRKLEAHTQGVKLNATSNIGKMDELVNTEEGQATDNVLLDKNGNVVYYITMVNDVYRVLLNMAAQDTSKVNRFPTTQKELDEIRAFAKKNNIDVLEPNALAIELKTSWVEASSLKNPEDFVTVEAIIPTHKKVNDSLWLVTKESKTTRLALVGMHIVGSARNHPEMIWSTFEHKSNTPNAKYQYVNSGGKTINVNPDNSGEWLFNQNPKDTAIANNNISFATFSSDSIIGVSSVKNPKSKITPSNTIRTKPWGSAYNVQPNAENTTTAAANSQVIAMNNSVMSKLMGKDVRKNYIFIGSTWTSGGAIPNGRVYNPNVTDGTKAGVSIGTSSLANSTMETNFQLTTMYGDAKHLKGHSCFTCHGRTLDPKVDDGLSHVFYPLMNGIKGLAVKKMVEK